MLYVTFPQVALQTLQQHPPVQSLLLLALTLRPSLKHRLIPLYQQQRRHLHRRLSPPLPQQRIQQQQHQLPTPPPGVVMQRRLLQ